MLRRINDVLPELILGILVYGFIIQLTGVWFVEDKLRYSVGLWIGIVMAVGMAINMAIVIRDSIEFAAEKQAKMRTTLFSLLRYVVVVIIFFIVVYFKLGNVITMFVGVMGLKIAAYVQPFAHKILSKNKKRGSDISTES